MGARPAGGDDSVGVVSTRGEDDRDDAALKRTDGDPADFSTTIRAALEVRPLEHLSGIDNVNAVLVEV
jgi:hypothetical protein